MQDDLGYRLLLIIAMPSLAVVSLAFLSAVAGGLADNYVELPGLLFWLAVLVTGLGLLLRAMKLKRVGEVRTATMLLAVVAVPALVGIGFFALIALLFILHG
jgi:hypothetical protein